MPQFSYRARDLNGQLVQGVVEASDRAGAILAVEQRRYVPVKIESTSGAQPDKRPESVAKVQVHGAAGSKDAKVAGSSERPPAALVGAAPAKQSANRPVKVAAPLPPAGAGLRISHGQRLFFTEQLAYLLSVGMTLDEALDILGKRLKQPALKQLTHSLHQSLIDGRSFSQALRDFPRIFSPLYVNLVMAGEASGALTDILTRLVKHLNNMKVLRDRVQQALIYPAFLAVAGLGLIIIFITVMVPQLMNFFANTNGGTLPLPTRMLIGANHLVVRYWWLALAIFIGGFSLFKAFTRSPAGLMAWDKLRLRIPALGSVLRYGFYAQFARTMGTLLQNGVTLLRTIELLEDMSGNTFLKARLSQTRAALVDGSSLSAALTRQKIFPDLYLDMMAVGEQSGQFAETMQMVADVYERELDARIKVATAIIPPLIIVLIAVVVGAVVFSIISAVFGVTNSLQMRMHG